MRSPWRPPTQRGRIAYALAPVIAGLRWWLEFQQLALAACTTVPRALRCTVGESDLCALAQALCKLVAGAGFEPAAFRL